MEMTKPAQPKSLQDILNFFSRESMVKVLKATLSFIVGPRDISLTLNVGGGSYTDGKKIVVGLPEMFATKSYEEMYIALVALLGHESQHVLSSNFNDFAAYNKKMTDYLVSKGVGRGYAAKVVHSVGNCIEDGRIEKILCNKLPGYVKKIQFLNMIAWDAREVSGEPLEDFFSVLILLCVLGIYPKGYKAQYAGTELDDLVKKIKPLIKKGINAITCKDGLLVCEEILYVMEDFLVRNLQQQEAMDQALREFLESLQDSPDFNNSEESEQNTNRSVSSHLKSDDDEEEGQQGSGSNSSSNKDEDENKEKKNEKGESSSDSDEGKDEEDGDSKAKKASKDKKDGKSSKKDDKTDEKEKDSKDGNGKDKKDGKDSKDKSSKSSEKKDKNSESNESNGVDTPAEDADALSEDEIQKRLKEISKDINEEANEKLQQVEKKEEKLLEQQEKNLALTTKEKADMKRYGYKYGFTEHPSSFPLIHELPQEIRVQAKAFRKEVEKIFKNKSALDVHSQNQGVLNPDDLWRTGMSDYNVFSIEGAKSRSDYAIGILQDGSGSMTEDKKEVESAYALSIIEEGLRGLVPFKIATFTAGHRGIEHYVVRGFNETSKKNHAYNFLRYRRAGGGNEDDYSIRVMTRELLRRPEKDKVLIVLSDGAPSSYEKTKQAIKEARDAKIHVVGIMFGSEYFRTHYIDTYKYMYEKNIIATDPKNISSKLSSTLRKILVR